MMATEIEKLPKLVAAARGRLMSAGHEQGWERVLRERDEACAQAQALEEVNQQLHAFLGIASHELRNPLTYTSLSLRLAAERFDTLVDQAATRDADRADQLAPVRGLLARAEDGLERMAHLVADLLDVSRLYAGQLGVRPACCDLATIVREAVEEQRLIAPIRPIWLSLPARETVPVWADAHRIRQVVTNYLTNACKYSKVERPVDVRIKVHAGWARVSVRDQGPGVPADEQQRIWEPFHRAAAVPVVSGSERGADESLGLGLHICKTIVGQHQGQVGVRSAPGRGSTFWFALPAIQPAGQRQARSASSSASR